MNLPRIAESTDATPGRLRGRAGAAGVGANPGIALFLLLITALVAPSCKRQGAAMPPPVVQVAELRGTNVTVTAEFIGQLDSPQNVQVRARVEAFVQKVLFTEGQPVKEGDPLFQLDPKPYEERLAAAHGMLAESEAALNKYLKDVARLEPLAEKRAIPQQDLDNARASVDIGKAGVLSAKARVDSAKLDLEYCDVRSPINGLIGAKEVSVGELVGKGEPTLLATISTLDPIWFYCAVSEVEYLRAEATIRETGRQLAQLPVVLILADGSTHPGPGRFVFIDRAVDVRTGTLRVRAEFPNEAGVLRPGMFGRIRVVIGTRQDAILVPERAVTELQGRNFVWVIDPENKATQRAVKVGEAIAGSLVILEGLKPADRIVVEGIQKVQEGKEVQVMTAEQMAARESATATPAGNGAKE
ncbi:MAG: efflux RND transporter periplasmic adaptor subunit [Limisphaerales bacterium]